VSDPTDMTDRSTANDPSPPPPADLLLIDDDPLFRDEMRLLLESAGYRVQAAGTIAQGRRIFAAAAPPVVLLDIELPDGKGSAYLPELLGGAEPPEVVMVSGAASLQEAADSIKHGAADFLEKPFEPHRLLSIVNSAMRIARLRKSNHELLAGRLAAYPLIGESDIMNRLRAQIQSLANRDVRILLLGESGTGKENVAGQIHLRSGRAQGPLVTVNCAALPGDLVESELFGHERGAYTGAVQSRAGRFRQAQHGTLLLDEIGDMPAAIQPKLLRVLESGLVTPVGGTRPLAVDVRVISSTNRDLEARIAAGHFRADLFYRINTVPLRLPALRERREDIPHLADFFLTRLSSGNDDDVKTLTPEAVDALMTHDWPGNVRELRNLMERLFYLTPHDRIESADVRAALGQTPAPESDPRAVDGGARGTAAPGSPEKHRLAQAVERFERDYLGGQLRAHEGNVTRLAETLRMDRGNLYRKLKRLGLLSA